MARNHATTDGQANGTSLPLVGGLRAKVSKARRYGRLMRRRAKEGHHSSARQLLELFYLRFRTGIRSSHYYAAGLYRSNLQWADKKNHMGYGRYLHQLDRINDSLYKFVAINKIVTNGIFQTFRIPTPPFYGVISATNGQTADGKPLKTSRELGQLIDRLGVDAMCFKLVGGWAGHGFSKVRIKTGPPLSLSLEPEGAPMTMEEFWAQVLYRNGHPAYLCQGVVEQHPEVAEIHPESVNTARIWMYQPIPGEWKRYKAILRMGLNSMCVDNTCAGGITSSLDVDTGRLEAAIDATPERRVYASHPSTGALLAGRTLPMWEEVKVLAHRTCAAFPYLRLLGLDIAFGKDGPLVLELEAHPDPIHQISFDHGVAPLVSRLAEEGPFDWRS